MAVLDDRGGPVAAPGADAAGHVAVATDGQLRVVHAEPRWQRTYLHLVVAGDAVAAVVAVLVANVVRDGAMTRPSYLLLSVLFPALWLATVALNRAYEYRFLGIGSEEFRRVGRAAVGLTAAATFTAYLTDAQVARRYLLTLLPLVGLLTLVGRYVLRRWLHHQRRKGDCLHRVVLVGHELQVLDLVERLGSEKYHGLAVVAACLPTPGQRPALIEAGIPVVGGFGSIAQAVRLTDADTVAVLASGDLGSDQLRRVAWELEPTGADLLVAPSLVEVAGPRLSIRPVSGLPLLQVEQPQFSGARRVVKTTFDRLLALGVLLVLAPLLATIAVAIRLTSPGPAIFTQQRIGRDGRPFTMYKFRSMVADAEQQREGLLDLNDRDGLMFKMKADPRVTRVGGWLRKFSLDELPQLFNVVLGQMSLVGPRPPLPEEVEKYADDVRRRLLVPPGVTGLWQVSGRADLSWEESVRLDLRYVDNWSLALDLQILWKTARAVLGGSGAY